jgi:hypothetical protein
MFLTEAFEWTLASAYKNLDPKNYHICPQNFVSNMLGDSLLESDLLLPTFLFISAPKTYGPIIPTRLTSLCLNSFVL